MTDKQKAYLVAEIEVHDPATFEEYRAAVSPIIASHGGTYLVRGGDSVLEEGEQQLGRIIVLEFPDMAAAKGFFHSDEYRPVADIRQRSATSRIYLVEGYAP